MKIRLKWTRNMQVSRKVNSSPLGLAVAVVINWGVELYGIEMTQEVAMSMAAIVMYVVGFFIHEAAPKPSDSGIST